MSSPPQLLADELQEEGLQAGLGERRLTNLAAGSSDRLEHLGQAPRGVGDRESDALTLRDDDLDVCFERFAEHEQALVTPLLGFLDGHPRVRLIGAADPSRATRVPTVSFTVAGRPSSELPPLLDQRSLAVRFGHFYAYRLIRDLGLMERDGVVRVSLVHYNTPDEVARVVAALDELL